MRTIKSRADTSVVRVGTVNLRAYPTPAGAPVTSPDALRTELFGKTIDARQENRRRFGRTLSMDRIEAALKSAYRGSMQDITDILHETVDTDPHLGSILNKRFGALAALPYEVQPATGSGLDREKAMFYAEVVRTQLRNMKSFRRNVAQLAWAMFNGRACLEKNWIDLTPGSGPTHTKYGQPSLAVADMDWIHPRRLSFGPQREIRIQAENVQPTGNFGTTGISVRDMPDKFIWWLPQLFNEYPEREGLGMRCMYWSFFKRYAARERMILTELYGKPWRIVEVDEESTADGEALKAADVIVDNLGSSHTARLPRGTRLNVVSPAKSAGDVHSDVIAESDAQNSKLVLGQTGTTDGVPSGFNNQQANVMQDEQLGVLMRDAGQLSDVFETMLTDRIIAINFGESEVTHAPTFRLRADLPSDRKAEIERLALALNAGLSIRRDEAYEVSGFGQPEDGDVIIRIDQPPTPPNSPVAPATRAIVVYPTGETPDSGEQQPPTPAAGPGEGEPPPPGSLVSAPDSTATVTVNEDRAARGLGDLMLPDGTPDPRGALTIDEFGTQIGGRSAPAGAPGQPPPPKDPALEPAPADGAPGAPVDEPAVPPHKMAASRVAYDVGDDLEDGDTPYGDGGIHGHVVRRSLEATGLDGPHMHVFKLTDGSYVSTLMDGGHMHGLATVDADTTLTDGEHNHGVMLSSGLSLMTTDDGSAHVHVLQTAATAVDGAHTHLLQVPDTSNPGGYSSLRSMTAAELAADIAAGLVPDELIEGLESTAEDSTLPYQVTTSPVTTTLTRTREMFSIVLASVQDAQTALDLVQATQQIEHDLTEWRAWCGGNVHLEHVQPATTNGTPEDLVRRGLRELTAQTSLWATAFEDAVANETTSFGIFHALAKARLKLEVSKFGRSLERNKLQALMLGVIDSVHELADLEPAEPVEGTTEIGGVLQQIGLTRKSLDMIRLADPGSFSKKPFKSALSIFKNLNVLDKPSFERASAAIKQRSFTVAGVMGDQMLQVLQSDLFASIRAGDDLRKFKNRIKPRLQDAGFVSQLGELKDGSKALSASHVETVFRTNTLNTYNTGRYVHASSPSVMSVFPVWECRAINDTRTRDSHAALNGKMFLANDAFWGKAYPPYGFNCRCRVIPRSSKYLSQVSSSADVQNIPDPGFTSGRPALALG